MTPQTFARTLFSVTVLFLSQLQAQDWSALRGAGAGRISPKGILSSGQDVRLKVRWKKPVGSGYSSVVVADGRVVVMQAQGAEDAMTCLAAKTGEQLWNVSIGPTFKGANGSFDGPLSTPVVFQGNVIGLSARGRLLSVNLRSGELNWQRELATEEGAALPLYGFTTSPVIAGKTLIVQIGAKDKLVVGIDPKTGKTIWSGGNDRVSSQTPTVYRLNGREILLASAGRNLTGIDPANGKVLFEQPHGGGNGSAVTPVDIGNGTVLLTVDDSFSSAFTLTSSGNKITARPEWKDRSIKNTYNIPVLHDGSVYGFSTRFLTCVDAKTGKPRWKNRRPGDGFLVVVDGHLVISTKKGSLHIAQASPSSYEEVTSAKVFDDLNWSIPAYSDNAVYMRSFGEVACVDITGGDGQLAKSELETLPTGPQFGSLLGEIEHAQSAAERNRLIDEFLGKYKTFPITEGDIVQFVYRGQCQDAAIACGVFGARQERKMVNVPGTDLHYYSMKLPRDQRANYAFLIDYKVQPDARNWRQTTSTMYAGEMELAMRLRNDAPLKMSWFAMPDWKEPAFASSLIDMMSGKIEAQQVKVKGSDASLPIDVYLPPAYSKDAGKRFPAIYVHDGAAAQSKGDLASAADAIFGSSKTTRQSILVFLKRPSNPMARGQDASKAIAENVVPFVDKTYRTIANRSGRMSYGAGFSCADALGLAGSNPDLFSAVSVQSPLVFDQGQDQIIAMFGKLKQPMRVRMEWGSYDMFNPHENWDIRTIGRKIADGIAKNKQMEVAAVQVNDSTDWLSWRNRFDQVLEFLLDKGD